MIEIKNLSVRYHNVLALDTVQLTIQGPTITGILGPNGAGKSTLLKAMLHIIDHEGQTTLDHKDIRKQRNKIAYVEQKAAIDFNFPIKVKECVSLGLYPKIRLFQRFKEEDWAKVARALEIVGMLEYADKQISELSGGQFQRVLIARCLVQEADYIFLDEPFVGIDSVSENIIMTTLRNLKKLGKTILIVHHDLSKVTTYFDQVLLLNRQLIAFGETDQTFTKDHLKATYGEHLILMEEDKK
ncbi:metal ABC transporter ATP-binding protein [Streptococcus acidominimus]|uniref:Manganese ABC transporter ATP-binding protein n=1 Tax=Streptococcus acidominimus TaxID=1326 RepID=A0A1Q8EBP5_STRAI|nr:metal ABC transporter ATP-binding protein [Streptococcus acidominimus]MBF0846230.1 metal ABC transporter ATP-binding protein [Streptococcus danieliae]MBF0817891.1 metal ABC transporter ATP-binding protein [Streptococcus acidominimus]MBF0838407.1 metal ABC transporter ATP-binding protein [Streptococcus acidominimus]OLF49218.1 manganese ABC transporter ATP-binding protein [Streptococcus acidominimus]TFU31879.1 metal ABC transporter ATP-binding protein [Streptococcus acidominimus]